MEKKTASLVMLTLLLTVMLTFTFDIQPVKATTIYVPFDYPTIQEAINAASNGDTVIVVGMVPFETSIVVNKSISVRGGGQFLDVIDVVADNASIRWFTAHGLYIAADNVSIYQLNIGSGGWFPYFNAIFLDGANECNILEVSVGGIDEGPGIVLRESSNNVIANSTIDTIQVGFGALFLDSSHNNTIVGNTIRANWDTNIYLKNSSGNRFFHNRFYTYWANHLAVEGNSSGNVWDAGYPDGGNYWNDYNGTDLYSGPYQNETGRDRIGDTPYIIDANNTDNYPLMSPTPWDITGRIQWLPDGTCDIRDVATVAILFGSVKGDGKYDEKADITGSTYLVKDDKIDIRDIALVALHFGEYV